MRNFFTKWCWYFCYAQLRARFEYDLKCRGQYIFEVKQVGRTDYIKHPEAGDWRKVGR